MARVPPSCHGTFQRGGPPPHCHGTFQRGGLQLATRGEGFRPDWFVAAGAARRWVKASFGSAVRTASRFCTRMVAGHKTYPKQCPCHELRMVLWMDGILHQIEPMRNQCLLTFTGESSFPGFLVRSGFRPSTVGLLCQRSQGVLYNLDGLCHLLHSAAPNARCAGLGDAAWWLESASFGIAVRGLWAKGQAARRGTPSQG